MTGYADEDNGAENFRCGHISLFPAVEIFKVLHPLLDNMVDFQVEEGEEEHWEDVEEDHGLYHVSRDVLCREPSVCTVSVTT